MNSAELRDLESLKQAVRHGARPNFLFFWGHSASASGTDVGKECLSQWYSAPFSLGGRTFSTAEHYMMFQKALLFRDDQAAERILVAKSPAVAKKLGRTVRGFVQHAWDDERLRFVADGNEAKFGQHPRLRAFLLATKDKVLVEASPRDRIWGIGLPETDSRAANPLTWRGLNLLGFALMIARSRLAAAHR